MTTVIDLTEIDVTIIGDMTTRTKAKQSNGDIHEEVRKAAKERVEEANGNNVSRMLRESTSPIITSNKVDSRQSDTFPTIDAEDDEVWKAWWIQSFLCCYLHYSN